MKKALLLGGSQHGQLHKVSDADVYRVPVRRKPVSVGDPSDLVSADMADIEEYREVARKDGISIYALDGNNAVLDLFSGFIKDVIGKEALVHMRDTWLKSHKSLFDGF